MIDKQEFLIVKEKVLIKRMKFEPDNEKLKSMLYNVQIEIKKLKEVENGKTECGGAKGSDDNE